MTGPNSATYWFPRICSAGLPVPRTELVPIKDLAPFWRAIDGEEHPGYQPAIEEVRAAARRIGYPVFIRSDLSSAKHDGPEGYRARSDGEVGRCVMSAFEHFAESFGHGEPTAWMVREFLNLHATFSAFGWFHEEGHPIAREWRYFATAERALCRHFYWPEDAIKFSKKHDEVPDWRERLIALRTPHPPEELDALAVRAAIAVSQPSALAWSVDFAEDRTGKWWLIDMAVAQSSWHDSSCPMKGMGAEA